MKRPSYLTRIFLALLLTLPLTACDSGNGGDGGRTISGRVTVPSGIDIAESDSIEVAACFGGDADPDLVLTCNFSSPNTQIIDVPLAGRTAQFTFANMAEGVYFVEATLREKVTGFEFARAEVDECNLDQEGVCQYLSPPVDSIDVTLRPVQNDFKAIVSGPQSFDLTGGEFAVCAPDPENDEACDEAASYPPIQVVRHPDTDLFGRQVWPFPAGNYVLLAGKDTDGDGVWDFWNCYNGNFDNLCDEVSPGSGLAYEIQIADAQGQEPPSPYNQPNWPAVVADGAFRSGLEGGTPPGFRSSEARGGTAR